MKTSFVDVTDGVTADERVLERVASGVANPDGVLAGDAVVLVETSLVPVNDAVTAGVNEADGVTLAVKDDTAVTFDWVGELVVVMI